MMRTILYAGAKLAGKAWLVQPIDSRALFTGSSEVAAAHGTETCRLRQSRQNKLILTK